MAPGTISRVYGRGLADELDGGGICLAHPVRSGYSIANFDQAAQSVTNNIANISGGTFSTVGAGNLSRGSASGTDPETAAVAPIPAPPILLQMQVDSDRSRVERMVGFWVPQVSSKAQGTLVNGHAFTDEDIVADHKSWVGRFPDAVLLRSQDYTTFNIGGYWVTVIADLRHISGRQLLVHRE